MYGSISHQFQGLQGSQQQLLLLRLQSPPQKQSTVPSLDEQLISWSWTMSSAATNAPCRCVDITKVKITKERNI